MNHDQFLSILGIDLWHRRSLPASEIPAAETTWASLEQQVSACTQCGLCKTRTQTVFGEGSHHAKLMIIGEAPGANEDLEGEPFVGRAGQLLDAMLASINLKRDDVFIANILKCRPPENRDPHPDEVATCTPYLKKQIALLQPTLILAVGRVAAQFLLKTTASLGSLRGKMHTYQNTPLMITYHPAYLLRTPKDKKKAYADWVGVKKVIGDLSNT